MMLYKKEIIVVDMPTTGRTLVLQQAGKMAAGTFVPQNPWTVADGTLVPQMTRSTIVAQRLIDFLPATMRKFGVTCEFVGLVSSKSDIKTMFTGLPDRKDTLPTLSHIEFRWREDDDRHDFVKRRDRVGKSGRSTARQTTLPLPTRTAIPNIHPSILGSFGRCLYIRSRDGIQADSEMPRTSSRLLLGSISVTLACLTKTVDGSASGYECTYDDRALNMNTLLLSTGSKEYGLTSPSVR